MTTLVMADRANQVRLGLRENAAQFSLLVIVNAFVGAMAAALERPAPERRLPEAPLRIVARTLGRLPGFPLTESRLDALTRRVRYPSRRIQEELGFRFRTSIETGLRRLLQGVTA